MGAVRASSQKPYVHQTGNHRHEYSRKLRNYYGDSSYHDIIVSESKKLYNENSFPISEVDEEQYFTCRNIMDILYRSDGEKFLQYCDALKEKCDNMSRHRMGESIEILEETLWNMIKVFSGYFFETSEGERFCYSVSGDEILISKRKESITRVDVNLAVEEILELNGVVESLQNMKVPGAGYLYPVFLRFGLIRRKGESDGHLSDMDNIQ